MKWDSHSSVTFWKMPLKQCLCISNARLGEEKGVQSWTVHLESELHL